MEETRLREKLARIEALFAGAATAGEREAAAGARERILARLRAVELESPPVEFKFTLADSWSRKLFLALLRRYDLRPYRFPGQRHTTVMVKVSKRFVDETLWPEYTELAKALRSYLEEVTQRVVADVLQGDSSEAEEVAKPKMLTGSRG